jgi:Domain of unknown function (DUF4188)
VFEPATLLETGDVKDQQMTELRAERCTAEIDGDFVVFLIGMRINKLWKPHKWLPVVAAMPRMLAELGRDPQLGLLHARSHFGMRNITVVQYWRSFAHLHRYAAARDHAHLPAWKAFNQAMAGNDDVGIWHETFIVHAHEHESIYNNMPPYGLGIAGRLVPAKGHKASAKGRLNLPTTDDETSP